MKKIFLLSLLLVTFFVTGCGGKSDDGKLHIVTSFYPMYLDAINIAGNVPGVEVTNLTAPQTGCLHDYQLTTEDMKKLESADIFIVNGLGMENFLDKVVESNKNLKIIDASHSDEIYVLKDGEEINANFVNLTQTTPMLIEKIRWNIRRNLQVCAMKCTLHLITCRTKTL